MSIRTSRTVWAEGGVTWAELDHETQAFGLATVGGAVSTTGIAGLTLGGGYGWLARKHGLVSDNLLAADVVTADGQFLHASAEENPDLFWGLRGGGGNFGVVTAFQYRLHELGPDDPRWSDLPPHRGGTELFRFYRDFSATAPDALSGMVALLTSPEGQPLAAAVPVYCGSPEAGEAALRPLRDFGYAGRRSGRTDAVLHHAGAVRPGLPARPAQLLEIGVSAGSRRRGHRHHGGALCARALALYRLGLRTVWRGHQPARVQRRRRSPTATIPSTSSSLRRGTIRPTTLPISAGRASCGGHCSPFLAEGVYVNYLGDAAAEGENRVRAAYGPATYDRLAALKRTYDPTNLFRLNQNIAPA